MACPIGCGDLRNSRQYRARPRAWFAVRGRNRVEWVSLMAAGYTASLQPTQVGRSSFRTRQPLNQQFFTVGAALPQNLASGRRWRALRGHGPKAASSPSSTGRCFSGCFSPGRLALSGRWPTYFSILRLIDEAHARNVASPAGEPRNQDEAFASPQAASRH